MGERMLSDILRDRLAGRAAPERPAGYDGLRQAASFFLLVDRDETHAFLVKKKETPGYTWSGQVGMVGGMIEKEDDDDLAAALREFEEELELPASSLEVFGDLGYFPSTIADALLHVFVARWNGEGEPVPDAAEIDYLIEVPLSVLQEIHKKQKLSGIQPDPDGKGPFYPIEIDGGNGPQRVVVWGVTARAAHSLLELVG